MKRVCAFACTADKRLASFLNSLRCGQGIPDGINFIRPFGRIRLVRLRPFAYRKRLV